MAGNLTLYGFEKIPDVGYPTLLIGPEGIGKQSWCIRKVEKTPGHIVLKTPTASDLNELHTLARNGGLTAVVIDLSETTEALQNTLLPLLENPNGVQYYLHSNQEPTQALVSRCYVHRMPLLSIDTLTQICLDHGMRDDQARLCAVLGQGIPKRALLGLTALRKTRHTMRALSALRDDSAIELDAICAEATQEDLDTLRTLIYEAETEKYTLWVKTEVSPLIAVLPQIKYVLNSSTPIPHIAFSAIMYAARLAAR